MSYLLSPGILEPQVFKAPGFVESLEVVEFNLDGTTSTITLTENQVAAQCVPFFSHKLNATDGINSYANEFLVDYEIWDDAGTPKLTVRRPLADGSLDISVNVVEFSTDIGVQQVITSRIDNNTCEGTMTAVDLDRTFFIFGSDTGGSNTASALLGLEPYSTTKVRIHYYTNGGSPDQRVYVIEDEEQAHFTVQHGTVSMSTSQSTGDISITEIDTDKTFVLGGHKVSANAYWQSRMLTTCRLLDSETIRFQRYWGSDISIVAYAQAITMVWGNVEHFSKSWSAATASTTVTLTDTFDTSEAFAITGQQSCYNTPNNSSFDITAWRSTLTRFRLTGSQEVTLDHLATSSLTAMSEGSVIQFPFV